MISSPHRTSTYKKMQPYLEKPIPAIKLKYFSRPTKKYRAQEAKRTDLMCDQCGKPIEVAGSFNSITKVRICDTCAIGNYQRYEGFLTREAAEARRRRIFDVPYLLHEMLTDDYMNDFGMTEINDVPKEDRDFIFEVYQDLTNSLSRTKRIDLENTANQEEIERFFGRLIKRWRRESLQRRKNA